MALLPGQLAAGTVPTSTGTAFTVTAAKTWQTTAAWVQNSSGAARTITLTFYDTDGTTILAQIVETLPTTQTNWPIGLGFPMLASQICKWIASGSGVYCIIGGVKN